MTQMPTRETTIRRPELSRTACPACRWLARFLARNGFSAGDRVRVIQAPRLVVIIGGDTTDDLKSETPEPPDWPWLLDGAGCVHEASAPSPTTPAAAAPAPAPAAATSAAPPAPPRAPMTSPPPATTPESRSASPPAAAPAAPTSSLYRRR